MTLRAKFKVLSVVETEGGLRAVNLQAVTTGDPAEAESLKWAVGVSINLRPLTPAVAKQFKSGTAFHIDFTPA